MDKASQQVLNTNNGLTPKLLLVAALLILTVVIQAFASTPSKPDVSQLNMALLADIDHDMRSLISGSRIEHCGNVESHNGHYEIECTASFEIFGLSGRETELVDFTYIDDSWRLKL